MENRRKKQIAASGAAAVLILALGLGGTLARYTDDESDGDISGQVETEIKLHDDYNSSAVDANPNMQTIDRDIYVENLGQTSLFVRVRLNEFMEYAGRSIIPGGIRNTKSTWKEHIPAGNSEADCGTGIHDYFTMQMGGQTQFNTGVRNRYNNGTDNFNAATAYTTENATVVTMRAYMALSDAQKRANSYWIYDEADGYAYWSKKLPGVDTGNGNRTTATGLLLTGLTNTGIIDESFYYGIQAKAEAVTEGDLIRWLEGRDAKPNSDPDLADPGAKRASTNAVKLLKDISTKYVKITAAMEATTPAASEYDKDQDGYLTKSEYNAYLEANPATH